METLLDLDIDMISGPSHHEKCQKTYEKGQKINFSTIGHPDLRESGSYYIIIRVIMSAIYRTNFMANVPYLGLIEDELFFFDLVDFFLSQ